jgi:hypothetical protein
MILFQAGNQRAMSRYSIGLFFLLFVVCTNVFSATEVDLYSESVVVKQNANQSEQNEAIKTAFTRLLVRVTGIEQILNDPVVMDVLDSGSKYLATFRFEASDVLFKNVLGESVPTKSMILKFDRKSVDSFLVKNRLPVWGAKRPDVLIWIADRLDGQDHILSDSEESDIALELEQQTERRGIPYLLPIMDLEDSLTLSFSEVYGLFSRDIERASERYKPEAILAGRIIKTADQYSADWLMMFKGQRLRLPTITGTKEFVISQGVDIVAQRLSEQYALVLDPTMLGNMSVKVVDIKDLNEFAALENYLNTINLITKITVHSFQDNNVVFDIEISGDQAQLVDVMSLDGSLIPIEEGTLEEQLDNTLLFKWQPTNN